MDRTRTFAALAIVVIGALACVSTAKEAPVAAPAGEAKPAPKTPTTRPARPKPKTPLVLAPIKDTPGLPRVLLIGDSISIGYTLPTRKLLAGKINLHRIGTNGGPTTRGLEQLDEWLGEGTWDVIHFNWGLHDLKYITQTGKLHLNGKQQVPPAEYEKNLRELVARLKKTGARLIWTTTTPVPEGAGGRIHGDAAKYNKIAAKVMAEAGIPVDDLYAFAQPRLKDIQRPKNVHFFPAGSEALARQVANSILKALGEPPLPAPTTQPAAAKPRPVGKAPKAGGR